jgi:hypothetical protein
MAKNLNKIKFKFSNYFPIIDLQNVKKNKIKETL